jgi:hypothetical protein
MVKAGKAGSPCPKGFLMSNTEFTDRSICLASRQYQSWKLKEIDNMEISRDEKERIRTEVVEKTCICHQLGNGALIALGIEREEHAPQSICPSPSIAWFRKIYTLKEMVDHIYGRGQSLIPTERPHMFAQEIVMHVDHFEKQVTHCTYTPREIETMQEIKNNLEDGMDFCLDISKSQLYQGENLASIFPCVEQQRARLRSICGDFENKTGIAISNSEENSRMSGYLS